jgi:hypothetical protein
MLAGGGLSLFLGRYPVMLWRVLVVAACLALLGWCQSPAKERLGGPTVAILTGATKVEVFRVDGLEKGPPQEPVPQAKRISIFPVIAQGKDQGREFAAKLAGILFDERTYTKEYKKCFWPGVAFRVWKGEEHVDVLICFHCSNFYCGPPTDEVEVTATFKGSDRRDDLVRLAQEAFPDDKEIQALPGR